jgi:uncharacterized membrane protein YhaH (DUF805 family)
LIATGDFPSGSLPQGAKNMGFGEAIATCFQKYVVFSGRAVRSEFWYWALFEMILLVVLAIVDAIVFGASTGVLSTLASLALFLPGLAVWARRLHDINRSGWWQLIAFVPLIGVIVLIVWACKRGTPGPNRFGLEFA